MSDNKAVWVVERVFPYESSEVIHVYSDNELQPAYIKTMVQVKYGDDFVWTSSYIYQDCFVTDLKDGCYYSLSKIKLDRIEFRIIEYMEK